MTVTVSGSGSISGLISGGLPSSIVTPANLVQKLTLAVAATLSGTSVDFGSIPSWVQRITIPIAGLSTNGSSIPIIQLGDSGGIETSGYVGTTAQAATTPSVSSSADNTGFLLNGAHASTAFYHGIATLVLCNPSTNLWTFSVLLGRSDASTVATWGGGSKSLSATLDRIRFTTVSGADSFDAGTVNILYEG